MGTRIAAKRAWLFDDWPNNRNRNNDNDNDNDIKNDNVYEEKKRTGIDRKIDQIDRTIYG